VYETGLLDILTGSGRPRTSPAVWCSMEQSLIDSRPTVDQWPAHFASLCLSQRRTFWTYMVTIDFSVLNELYFSHHAW